MTTSGSSRRPKTRRYRVKNTREFPIWFKSRVAALGLTAKEAGEAAGLDETKVSKAIIGGRMLAEPELDALAASLAVTRGEILGRMGLALPGATGGDAGPGEGGGLVPAVCPAVCPVRGAGWIDGNWNVHKGLEGGAEGAAPPPPLAGLAPQVAAVCAYQVRAPQLKALHGAWVYVMQGEGREPDAEVLGRACLVEAEPGEHLSLRVVDRGFRVGRWCLSAPFCPEVAPPMETDAKVARAWAVLGVILAGAAWLAG